MLLVGGIGLVAPAQAATVNVCAACTETTIMGAITNAAANEDLIIILSNETYNEYVKVREKGESDDFKGDDLTIQGDSGGGTTIDGNNSNRVLYMYNKNVTISDVTLINGYKNNKGGGVYVDSGTLTATNCAFTNNEAYNSHSGGAIYNNDTLILNDCTITKNTATSNGGGIYNDGGTVTINGSSFGGSTATSNGGGIYNDGGTVTINGSSFGGSVANKNTADSGGGIYNNGGTLTVTGCDLTANETTVSGGGGIYSTGGSLSVADTTFSSNIAKTSGGGIYNAGSNPTVENNCVFSGNKATAGGGGGIYSTGGTLNVSDATFNINTADTSGGGIYNTGGTTVNVTDSTFDTNTAAENGGGMYNNNIPDSFTVSNCTFSKNEATDSGGGMFNNNSDPTVSQCTFSENIAKADNSPDGGGGMYNDAGSEATVENCTFYKNDGSRGGGMANRGSGTNATITNCTFSENIGEWGGGLYSRESSNMTVTNCTITGNKASGSETTNAGGGIRHSGATTDINNTIVMGNISDNSGPEMAGTGITSTNGHNLIGGTDEDDFTWAATAVKTDNIIGKPVGEVLNTTLSNCSDPDLPQVHTLIDSSWAKDAGTSAGAHSEDQCGTTRPQGAEYDIGAYEYPAATNEITTGSISGSPFYVSASSDSGSISVPYAITGTYNVGNTFTAYLSDASGGFSSPVSIGTRVATDAGTITVAIPAGTAGGTGYRIRVDSNDPAVTGSDNGSDLTVTLVSNSIAPTAAQNINVSADGTQLTVTETPAPDSRQWKYGTASGGPYSSDISGQTSATYTPNFSSAGTYYVVCASTKGSVTVTSNEVQVTVIQPAVNTGSISGSPFYVSALDGASISVPYTITGTYTSNTFTAYLSDASGDFSSETSIGTLNSDSTGTISGTIPAGTSGGTGYKIRVKSSDPAVTGSESSVFTVTLVNNSIAPTAAQSINVSANGTQLTVTETPAADSRQWKYGTASGGPYSSDISGQTSATYTPNFSSAGTYYVVCASTKGSVTVTSGEVLVTVLPTIAVTGTITAAPGNKESSIVTGGSTIVITLSGDTWDATVGNDNTKTSDLIDGISGDGDWTDVNTALSHADVTRTSDTVVTITLPAISGYAIGSDETVSIAVPHEALATTTSDVPGNTTLTIVNEGASLTITGTIQNGSKNKESDIVSGGSTIIITVSDDTWESAIGDDNTITTALINGITGGGGGDWADVTAALSYADVARTSATVVTITLPAVSAYAIGADETVNISVPHDALVTTSSGSVPGNTALTITNESPTATITGTIQDGSKDDESDIVAGVSTIIITLSGDIWEATVGDNNTITTDLIDGITGGGGSGWAAVKSALSHADVTRTSDTVVTITLPAISGYAIGSDETVSVSVPHEALASTTSDVSGNTTLTIMNESPTATISGTIQDDSKNDESDIVAGASTIIITLSGDTWEATVGDNNSITTALIAGISGGGGSGWAAVTAVLSHADVIRSSDTVVTITLPAVPGYAIGTDETVSILVPHEALASTISDVSGNTDLTIVNGGVSAIITGTIQDGSKDEESDIITGGSTIIITLSGDTWGGTVGNNNAITTALIDGITGNGDWADVTDVLSDTHVIRTSNTVVTITLPAVPAYAISSDETVSILIPHEALATTSSGAVAGNTTLTIVNEVPTITISGTPLTDFGNVVTGSTSGEKSYTVAGSNLTAAISITPPTGFHISTGSGGSFVATNPITLSPTGGTVSATTIYVKFAPGSTGSVSENISHTSTDASSQNVAVNGKGIATEPSTQATLGAFSSVGPTSMTINWSGGNGAYSIVVMRSGSAVSTHPTDGTTYTADGVFTDGTAIGSGSAYVVYKGSGSSATVTGLDADTTYHVAVYEYNGASSGTENYLTPSTATGSQKTALPTAPTVTTAASPALTTTSASVSGTVSSDGGATVTERGVYWSTSTIASDPSATTDPGHVKQTPLLTLADFTILISGLTPDTTYYAKAYAKNAQGTTYGNEVSFTTPLIIVLPSVSTVSPNLVTTNSASSGGNITNDGGATVTARGVCWSTSANPTTANSRTNNGGGTGSFVSSITGLSPGTTYYVRAYAANSAGTAYGQNRGFTTPKASQSISFGTLGNKTYGDPSFTVSASASSGLPVSFTSLTPSVATISDNTVSIVGGGTATIRASQAGNGTYNAAPNVDQTFTVNKADQTITFDPIQHVANMGDTIPLTATASSGLTVSFRSTDTAIASVSGNTATIRGAGTVSICASQGGNTNYNPAVEICQSLTANSSPAITEGDSVSVTMDEDGIPTKFDLTLNATDADSDGIRWSVSETPSFGMASVSSAKAQSKKIYYNPPADWSGTDNFEIQVSDEWGGTDSITVRVTVRSVNDAPVLDPGESPALDTIEEDPVSNPGNTVAEIVVDDSITEPADGSPREAIAVTSVNNTHGIWEYDSGAGWQPFSEDTGANVSFETSARLLDSSHRIRFVPKENYPYENPEGVATLTFRAWDKSEGSQGGTRDATSNGGTSPFSQGKDHASIIVTQVDDPPVVENPIPDQAVLEDADSGKIDLKDVFTDVDNSDDLITWEVSENTMSSLVSPSIDANGLILDYLENQSGKASLTILANSNGKTVSDEFDVNVYPVNDAPWIPPLNPESFPTLDSIDEDTDPETNMGNTVAEIIGDRFIDDPDTGEEETVQAIAVTGVNNIIGTWQYSTDDGANWNDFTPETGQVVVMADEARLLESDDRIRFIPNETYYGTSQFTFRAWDQTDGSTPGGTADTTTGSLAFSAASDEAKISVEPVDNMPMVADPIDDMVVGLGSPPRAISIANVFTDVDNDPAAIIKSVQLNSNEELVSVTLYEDWLLLDFHGDSPGMAEVWILGMSNGKPVLDDFLVTVRNVPDSENQYDPTLPAFPELTDIDEDASGNPGNTVAEIFEYGFIRDVRQRPVTAIAVTSVNNVKGQWQYTLDECITVTDDSGEESVTCDESVTWHNFTEVIGYVVDLDENATLLDSENRIRFVPGENYFGNAAFTFLAWDESEGEPGEKADTLVKQKDSSPPFTEAADEVSINVLPVDDPPVPANSLGDILIIRSEDGTILADDPSANIRLDEKTGNLIIELDEVFTDVDNGLEDISKNVGYTNPSFVEAQIDYGHTLTLNFQDDPYGASVITVRAISNGQEVTDTFTVRICSDLKGDVNGNGSLDLGDLVLALQTVTGTPAGYVSLYADVNQDGKIGIQEAVYILTILISEG